jgi:hypothetical protein
VRNVYGFELDEERMTPLMARIEATAQDLAIQVRALADYLEAMGRALNAE